MPRRLSIFNKMALTIVLLLVPVLLLYSYSNRISTGVVEEQMRSSNLSKLIFFMDQLDGTMENLSMFPVILSDDPHIRDFLSPAPGEPESGMLKAQARVTEKLGLQSVSSPWSNDLTFAFPEKNLVLSSNIYLNGSEVQSPERKIVTDWAYEQDSSRGYSIRTFVRETGVPAAADKVGEADAVIQVRFPVQNISDMLDVYKKENRGDPFLFLPDMEPVRNSTYAEAASSDVIRELGDGDLGQNGQLSLKMNGQTYLVSYVKSRQLGWYLIDYVPVKRIVSPIIQARNWFYGSIVLLILIGLLASVLLYRNVQIPLSNMIAGVKRMKSGDLSWRIGYKANNEFDELIRHHNEMAGQIQRLIEDVYTEKLRSREATLKQLQSQINPHFLYNSLFFIINSAMLEDRDSVISMSENLAEFYRYTTKVDNQLPTVRDELEFVSHYLNIHTLRMGRLTFEIEVPEAMLDEPIPRLTLQPIVENAIVHGIEGRVGGGHIVITGRQDGEYNYLEIADNGAGMSEDALLRLESLLDEKMTDEIGCGTWNVHQRLRSRFGEGSGLRFRHGVKEGLVVTVCWLKDASRSLVLDENRLEGEAGWPSS
ncbi:two-component system, sensor histidine kinase YesM [Paenibacillus catalpae]|uniref:Two-component system, sensor histidine kinase YesM n=1 Tax=Paenibacillus catalpae TaxID=1045775 RepID=A0A1I1U658_9BACL|nr:histidine kinase [Paenibacillus catalpae]SFD65058.1 two-component system, sensor histidine kinase YesM [Paenibacillus catalpae]